MRTRNGGGVRVYTERRGEENGPVFRGGDTVSVFGGGRRHYLSADGCRAGKRLYVHTEYEVHTHTQHTQIQYCSADRVP